MGKTYRKNDRGGGPKRREGLLGKLAKRRNQKAPHIRRRDIIGKVWCKVHGWNTVGLLSSLACPGCSVEREVPDVLC